ncbi:hypothetical protein BT63DRAFT_477234 [Microthyrium microscopicum]|uniref:Uncharacterized protein n=1 Tax=Microthyrium microscopicum TaxID=703497 RepID=A0A6A6ULT8_9PEZI|nr:hypothetical protein BT63DRAFT_477234 [Microthyrium microscopicum]
MSGFPSLKPAFTVRAKIDPGWSVGSASRGTPLTVVPMVGGTVKSEPGFEPAVDAELHGVGYDYIRGDATGGHLRLDVRSQLKTKDGELVAMYYKGPMFTSPAVMRVLTHAEDMKTTEYGDSFMTFEFETGSEKYKELETMVFCAAGHFEISGEDTIVEYKVCQVVKG